MWALGENKKKKIAFCWGSSTLWGAGVWTSPQKNKKINGILAFLEQSRSWGRAGKAQGVNGSCREFQRHPKAPAGSGRSWRSQLSEFATQLSFLKEMGTTITANTGMGDPKSHRNLGIIIGTNTGMGHPKSHRIHGIITHGWGAALFGHRIGRFGVFALKNLD